MHLEVGQFTFIESLFLSSDGEQGASRLAAARSVGPCCAYDDLFSLRTGRQTVDLTEAFGLTMDHRAAYRAILEGHPLRHHGGYLDWAGCRGRRTLD